MLESVFHQHDEDSAPDCSWEAPEKKAGPKNFETCPSGIGMCIYVFIYVDIYICMNIYIYVCIYIDISCYLLPR